ncbi:hypothetical protein RFM99_25765 [Mesorhizobium sp. VK4C]|uniref:hypothetical protein n=1 Tax=Mesorhizobium captivum TaxID=3072319 RepID=UPI002A23F25E|nr:hypothetical protein [Mesorhizobium sp. VK4C]MDX8501809.1 hypothetical protein [Mesorhizobium sp. VK4C]
MKMLGGLEMGTGSFGGAGSGALGRSGSGAGTRSIVDRIKAAFGGGAAEFFSWRSSGVGPDAAKADQLVRDTLKGRNVGGFLLKVLTSATVNGCFDDLFKLSAMLRDGQWEPIAAEFGIGNGPGCFADLASRMLERNQGGGETAREVANSTILDVLIAVCGSDDLFLDGTADQILASVHVEVLDSLSGHFLGALLWRDLQRELPPLQAAEIPVVKDAAQRLADHLIERFDRRFHADGVSHRDLLRTVTDNQQWTLDKLREKAA